MRTTKTTLMMRVVVLVEVSVVRHGYGDGDAPCLGDRILICHSALCDPLLHLVPKARQRLSATASVVLFDLS